ncbi:hypothetical protein LZ30DRAFT_735617 [Colletotrichum cereale]|nr:hypothetical protein LZ30DRAFT_735617 [Colletotrichum cereale]
MLTDPISAPGPHILPGQIRPSAALSSPGAAMRVPAPEGLRNSSFHQRNVLDIEARFLQCRVLLATSSPLLQKTLVERIKGQPGVAAPLPSHNA